jgi:hypothetical protein
LETALGDLDGLVRYDNKLIVIQGKWKTLTLAAREGDVTAARIDLKKALADSYEQGVRARDYIIQQEGLAIFTDPDGNKVTVDPKHVKEIYLVSVLGRGAMAFLAVNLPRLDSFGMFKPGDYPWAISLSELRVVMEFMEFPSQLFDYLRRRNAVMKDGRFKFHDEWDLLGCYLDGLLDPAHPQFLGYDFVLLPGIDTSIERYFRSQANPALPREEKPRRRLPDPIKQLILTVERSNQPGKTDFNIVLLGFPNQILKAFSEQVATALEKTKTDRKIRSMGVSDGNRKCGMSMICGHGDPQGLSDALISLCQIRKYEARAGSWIGIAIDVALTGLVHAITYLEHEWVPDAEIESLLPLFAK